MSDTTKIEWCDSTFNPWIGCTKVGSGCDHCYAEKSTPARTMSVVWGPKAERHRTSTGNWKMPLRWEREHEAFFAQHGRRRRVFCASLADVFDNQAPPAWRAELFALIAATPHLDWLLVTKRIGNVPAMLQAPGMQKGGLPANVWLGITVVNQDELDRDLAKLYAIAANVRFLSVEPMLGPLDFDAWPLFGEDGKPLLHWVICGGESGPEARPMHPDWARDLRDQCADAGVPFLFKQWGEWTPGENVKATSGTVPTAKWFNQQWDIDSENLACEPYHCDYEPDLYRIGKKAAGRLLDGIEHNGFPDASPQAEKEGG